MKIGIAVDGKANKWGLQRFEPLRNEHDITVFIGERNTYDVRAIELKKHFLRHSEEILLALKSPATAYKRIIAAPYRKMDFYYFSLRRYLKGMDIVYTSDIIRSAYTLASLKDNFGFKFILSWWENIPHRVIFDERESFMKKFVMEKVDLFLPFTRTAKKALQLEGIPEEKLRLLYPGVDTDRFRPGPKPLDIMSANKIDMNSFVILYVGQLVSWKGVHNLIYAAKILKQKRISDFTVAIVGKGAQKENMKKLIKETGTEGYFRFLDFVPYDILPDIYRMADVFVLPSYPTMTWQEQFGFVLTEAMASGKAVISTMTGSIPEVVGDCGILIPPGDFYALADSLQRLMEDRPFREGLGRKARDRAMQLFCNKKNAQELSALFSEIKKL